MSPRPRLAAVILTRDEEAEIEGCIAAARRAGPDEIVVLDSGSVDRTRELAAAAGARVVTEAWRGYVDQRNLAWGLTDADWVLFLDADERVTPEAAADVRALLAGGGADALRFRRRTFTWGRRLRCKEPDWQVRLARRGAGRWTGAHVHERLRVDGAVADARGALDHEPWDGLGELLAKKQAHAELAARGRWESGRRFRWLDLAGPPLVFAKHWLVKGGVRDGRAGLIVSLAYAIYSLEKVLYLLEREVIASGATSASQSASAGSE